MPTILFEDETIDCRQGANLLRELPKGAVSAPPPLDLCKSGTCGMCKVNVQGECAEERSDLEQSRLSASEDESDGTLRLACQTEVDSDLQVTVPDD